MGFARAHGSAVRSNVPEAQALVSVIACSGQAFTHRPHASHAFAFVRIACCHLCAKPFNLPLRVRPLRCSFGKVPTAKTETGQTRAQSAFPSQAFRSITGRNAPAACLHASVFGKMGRLDLWPSV